MLEGAVNIFKVKDLRNKLLYTLLLLFVYRIGRHVPTPGINGDALYQFMRTAGAGTLLGFYDIFAGGAFSRATIFALGIMPYISASIIIQLLVYVVPALERLHKEGDRGRKVLTQYTRIGTVLICIIQSFSITQWLRTIPTDVPIITMTGPGFIFVCMITFTAGTIFIMWLGEQITEYGIGNGISLIIFTGIVARLFPSTIKIIAQGDINFLKVIIIVVAAFAITAFVVLLTLSSRKIIVQYPNRIQGRRMYQGQRSFLPIRINAAGMIPIIFAQSMIMFPTTIAMLFKSEAISNFVNTWFGYNTPLYLILLIVLVGFFTYFYTAIAFNPEDVSNNMKRYGGFVPGIRPGKKTTEYIERILSKLTFIDAVYLGLMLLIPQLLIVWFGIPADYAFIFGGGSILIIVGVALDTMQQVESQLIMRRYEGFLKKGKMRSRRG